MEQMKALIVSAIKDRKILELIYKGHPRVVEPHAYGRDKDGDEIIRCYQVAGGSASGETTGWKVLKLMLTQIHGHLMLMQEGVRYAPKNKTPVPCCFP